MGERAREVDLSIIIVNWNVREYLRACINSITAFVKELNYEIIVVDNASTDGSVDMLTADFPDVKTVANRENVGFGQANNQAAESALGRWLLLLNPDTLLESNLPKTLMEYAERARAEIVGPRVVLEDGGWHRGGGGQFITAATTVNQSFLLYRLLPKSDRFRGFYLSYDYPGPRPVDWVSGCSMLIKREVFAELRGFDPKFFLLSEDMDLCRRAKQAGVKVAYCPEVTVIHFEGRSIDQQDNDLLTAKSVGYNLLLADSHGFFSRAGLLFVLWLGYGLRVTWFACAYLVRRTARNKQRFEMSRKYKRLTL